MNTNRVESSALTEQSELLPISIIMPTYQGARYLDQLLPVLKAQDYPAPVEIVAVDSSSTDGTPDKLRAAGATVTIIPKARFGHGYARNLAVRNAQYPILVFMSQDALPVGTDWLRCMIEPLADPKVGALYVRQLARPDATPFEKFFHEKFYPARSNRYKLTSESPITLERIFFSNVCSAARREVCLAHPFDETLIMSEDQAFARALLTSGYETLYLGDVQVIHSHHYDLKTLFRRNFDSAYSLKGVANDSWRHTARQAIDYIASETAYVIKKGQWLWLLAIPPYEGTRIAGRLAGKFADRLPGTWRTRLSLHQGHWTRELADSDE